MHPLGVLVDYDEGKRGGQQHCRGRGKGWGWQGSEVGVAWGSAQQLGDKIGSVNSVSGLKAEMQLPFCTGSVS